MRIASDHELSFFARSCVTDVCDKPEVGDAAGARLGIGGFWRGNAIGILEQ